MSVMFFLFLFGKFFSDHFMLHDDFGKIHFKNILNKILNNFSKAYPENIFQLF